MTILKCLRSFRNVYFGESQAVSFCNNSGRSRYCYRWLLYVCYSAVSGYFCYFVAKGVYFLIRVL